MDVRKLNTLRTHTHLPFKFLFFRIKMPMAGVMVCGFDVTRSSLDKRNSYGAFIASMDLQKTVKFFSSVMPHTSGTECSNNIGISFQKAVRAYHLEHGNLPEKIIIYRDGVGDGDLQHVKDSEVQNLMDALKLMYQDRFDKVKFAFVIVSKRINTRFFEETNRGCKNPLPGTVVDDVVTLPER